MLQHDQRRPRLPPAAPWIVSEPGAALFVTVLGVNFVGDAVRDPLEDYVRVIQEFRDFFGVGRARAQDLDERTRPA